MVVPPLTLAVAVADDSYELGQSVVMTADIESFFGDTVVEAFIGTNMAGMATNPTGPVVFQIATDDYEPGRYALVVREAHNGQDIRWRMIKMCWNLRHPLQAARRLWEQRQLAGRQVSPAGGLRGVLGCSVCCFCSFCSGC